LEIGKERSKQWRSKYGKARAVEIKMWRSKSKDKDTKGRKECFESGMKIMLRIGGDSDQEGDIV